MEGFRGTDDRAKETISRIDPVYRPWFRSLWEPPGAEVECLLFGIQAAAGAGLLGFALGHRHGRRAVGSDA
jgi:cobalt/nickel transport protein